MAKLTLYHASPSRSSIVRWMLEEIGEPYDIHLLRLMEGDQMKADYLTVNPMGKVPALKHGDVVVTEAAHLHVPCRRLSPSAPERADRRSAPRPLSQMAVLRSRLR